VREGATEFVREIGVQFSFWLKLAGELEGEFECDRFYAFTKEEGIDFLSTK
jgi:hypothetical protein